MSNSVPYSRVLQEEDLSPTRAGRNIYYAVYKHFQQNKTEIEQSLKEKLELGELMQMTIRALSQNPQSNINAELIKKTIAECLRNISTQSKLKQEDPFFAQLETALHAPQSAQALSQSQGLSFTATTKKLRLLEQQDLDPRFTRSPAPEILDQEIWQNDLRPKEREAATLHLYGFDREEISTMMDISRRTLTNYLLDFRKNYQLSEIEVQDIAKKINRSNISRADDYKQRALDFLFDDEERQAENHFIQSHSDTELVNMSLNLLRQYPNKSSKSIGIIKSYFAGASIAELAEQYQLTESTVRRDLHSIRSWLKKQLQILIDNPIPINLQSLNISKFKWACLDDDKRTVVKSFAEGKNLSQIAKAIKSNKSNTEYYLRDACQRLGITVDNVKTLAHKKIVKTNQPNLQKERLLKKLYPEQLPQNPNKELPQKDFEQAIYQTAIAFFNITNEQLNRKIYLSYLRGLNSGQIDRLLDNDTRLASSKIQGITKRLRRHILRQFLLPNMLNSVAAEKQSRLISYSFPETTASMDINQKLALANKLLNFEPSPFSIFFKPYIKGFSIEEISLYLNQDQTKITKCLDKDLALFRKQIANTTKIALPSEINKEIFANLSKEERLAIAESLSGKQIPEIFQTQKQEFEKEETLRSTLSRACQKLGITKKVLDRLRSKSAAEKAQDISETNSIFIARRLLRIVKTKGINPPQGISQQNLQKYQWQLANFMIDYINKNQSDIAQIWTQYLAGASSPYLAEMHNIDKKQLQIQLANSNRQFIKAVTTFNNEYSAKQGLTKTKEVNSIKNNKNNTQMAV